MFSKSALFKILLNTLIGTVLILLWLRFVNLKQVLATISTVDVIYLIPAFVAMSLSALLRALRLKIFLSPIKKISLIDLTFLNGAAMMLNFFIPIRAGEIAKGVYLSTSFDLNLTKSIIWVFLDRFVDFLVVLIAAAVLFFIIPTSLSIKFIIVITIILSFAVVLTYLIVYHSSLAKNLAYFFRKFLIINVIKIYFDRFFEFWLHSFDILKRTKQDLTTLLILTVLAYAADGAIWYFIFAGLHSPQPYLKMYLGQLLSALTYLIPAAPGYVGSAEASGLVIFSGVFGLDANLASSMTVIFHLASAIFILIYGLISVYFLKIDLGSILKKALRQDK